MDSKERAMNRKGHDGVVDERFSRGFEDSPSEEESSAGEVVFEQEDLIREESIVYGQASRRLAILNLDWDIIDGKDIYRTLEAFLPPGGSMQHVRVYKSKEGKKMLEIEEKEGPILEPRDSTEKSKAIAIRKYLLKRMRYFYAVAEFDSEVTAEAVYQIVDGVEIGKTMNYMDVRFIPGDHAIDDEMTEEATSAGELGEGRTASSSVYHSKVSLGWEEDEKRGNYLRGLFTDKNLDLSKAKDLIDISDEDQDDEKQDMYKRVLLGEQKENASAPSSIPKTKPRVKKSMGKRKETSSGESDVDSGFEADPQDPRFAERHTEGDFAIDAMDPSFKTTKGSKRRMRGRRSEGK